jgi:glycosyltransferase involved in cell wall biosynthesis
MKVAYLVNQYPARSHTFIRREILALEARGVGIDRHTIRRSETALIDPQDIAEQKKTHCILDGGIFGLMVTTLLVLVTRPVRFARSLKIARKLAHSSSRGWIAHFAYLAEACELLASTRKAGIHHVHAHFGTNSASVAMLWKNLGGGSFSFTVHGSSELTRPEENSLELKMVQADFVVAISQHCRSQLYRWCPLASWGKIKVVHCGLDRNFLEQVPRPIPEIKRFFWAGRFTMLKGLPILIAAGQILKQWGEEFEIVLAGDGPLRGVLEETVESSGLMGLVQFPGWISDSEVKSTLEESRCMVLPSFSEGLPVAIMESLALGRPVIASRITAVPELVDDGVSGWTVTPGEPQALADAMRVVIQSSTAQLEKMGRAGKAAVLERHDIRSSAAQLEALFEECRRDPGK